MKIWYYPVFAATLLLSEIASAPSDYPYDVRASNPIKKVFGDVLEGAGKVIGKLQNALSGEEGVLRCRPFSRYYDYDYYGEGGERFGPRKRDVSDFGASKESSSLNSTETGEDSTEEKDSSQPNLEAVCQIQCLEVSTLGGFILEGICYCIYF
nr:unnamed protein product [Callosobruchus analis]